MHTFAFATVLSVLASTVVANPIANPIANPVAEPVADPDAAANLVARQTQCFLSILNEKNEYGCFQFSSSSFKANTIFPFNKCSVQANPRGGSDPCAGLVSNLSAACGTGRQITFGQGACPARPASSGSLGA